MLLLLRIALLGVHVRVLRVLHGETGVRRAVWVHGVLTGHLLHLLAVEGLLLLRHVLTAHISRVHRHITGLHLSILRHAAIPLALRHPLLVPVLSLALSLSVRLPVVLGLTEVTPAGNGLVESTRAALVRTRPLSRGNGVPEGGGIGLSLGSALLGLLARGPSSHLLLVVGVLQLFLRGL